MELIDSMQQVMSEDKQSNLFSIPEGWNVFTIQTLLDNKYILSHLDGNHGEQYPRSDEFKGYGIPYIGANDFSNGFVDFSRCKFLSETKAKLFKKGVARDGDILFAHNATVGPVALLKINLDFVILSTTATYFRCNEAYLCNVFLGYALQALFFVKQYQAVMAQSTRFQVPITTQRKLSIMLPPLPEQTAIATALSDVDALIASLDKLVAKKRDIKQATMQQLLMGEMRLPAFCKQLKRTYKQTELGKIPEAWEVKSISDVVTDFRGGAPLMPDDFTRDGVKVLPKGGVIRGGKLRIGITEQQYCSQKYAEAHKSNQVNGLYTIVVLRDLVPSGPNIGLMVKIEDTDNFVLAQGVYGFKVKQDKVNTEYLIQFSNGFNYRKLMNNIMVGSTQVHITNTAFKKVMFPTPPLPEQQAIANILSDMDAEIVALEQKREKTRALKQGMMQELLTGKTRLL